ncbi:MAG: XRE family transcriptional regulator [Rhodospirillales bacterium]
MSNELTTRLAERLKALRQQEDWSLDRLAAASGVSRATLSRLEKAEVSPTAEVLGRLCKAYGLSMSRLLAMVESGFTPLVRRDRQMIWSDAEAGFTRRAVSPLSPALSAEVLACELAPGSEISYDRPPQPGQEHHLYLLEGALDLEIEGEVHRLAPGDCLRYRLFGPSRFRSDPAQAATYILVLV